MQPQGKCLKARHDTSFALENSSKEIKIASSVPSYVEEMIPFC